MLAATLIAIFLIPVTYNVVERFADRRGERAGHCARWRELSGSASARLKRVHAGRLSRAINRGQRKAAGCRETCTRGVHTLVIVR